VAAKFVATEIPVAPPTTKKACKKGGWKTFNDPSFKNQGACISTSSVTARHPRVQRTGPAEGPSARATRAHDDRRGCSTANMLSRESVDLEQRLAKLLGADPADVRSYICEVIEERLWGRSPKGRKTGFRFVRGTHGGAFVRDPEGNDTPPVGYEAPRVT